MSPIRETPGRLGDRERDRSPARGWQCGFYRTAAGAELDLVLERGRRRITIECKVSTAPTVSRGFWNALDDLGVDEAWVVGPVTGPYPLREGVTVAPLRALLNHLPAP